ncbi:MAG: hypothetical protein Q8Q97_02315 [bacterium]|nr:hypothetical protein [bacterium]
MLAVSAALACYAWLILGPVVGGVIELFLRVTGFREYWAFMLSMPASGLVLWLAIFAILMYLVREHPPRNPSDRNMLIFLSGFLTIILGVLPALYHLGFSSNGKGLPLWMLLLEIGGLVLGLILLVIGASLQNKILYRRNPL